MAEAITKGGYIRINTGMTLIEIGKEPSSFQFKALESLLGSEYAKYDIAIKGNGKESFIRAGDNVRGTLGVIRQYYRGGPSSQPLSSTFRQGNRGAVEFMEDGKAIIHAFESADISTLVHEVAHIFRRHLAPDILKQAEDALGVTDSQWSREADEAFADGFERYVSDGVAPIKGLKKAFESLKVWLTNIYKAIVGTPLEKNISPQLKEVFGRGLGAKPVSPTPPPPAQEGYWETEVRFQEPW